MRNASYVQVFVMAAIVATLFLPPLAGIAWLVSLFAGFSFASLLTFGERVGEVAGLGAWWGIFFLAAIAYAASMRGAA
ncbi:MAG: hypothetical protein ACT4P3_19680 [Betaproteobacteria bacterium]